jgi:multiple RNA-binding domain-containing protein 1
MEKTRRLNFDNETSWNYLFLNPNAVTNTFAKKHNIDKGQIMSKDEDNLAVRMGQIEAQIIKESRAWMIENGLNLKAIEGSRKNCARSDKIILVKNLAEHTTPSDMRAIFERHGVVMNCIVSPSGTLGIVEYRSAGRADVSVQKLQHYYIKGLPMYLEFAPTGLIETEE